MGCEAVLRGFDNRGSVRLAEGQVLRSVTPDYRPTALRLFAAFEQHQLSDMGFVETRLATPDGALLEHTLHPISYPHEWPAVLLKRAALFLSLIHI